jgi:beta-mannanase
MHNAGLRPSGARRKAGYWPVAPTVAAAILLVALNPAAAVATPSCQGITTSPTGAPVLHKCASRIILGVSQPPSPQDEAVGLTGSGADGLTEFATEVGHPVAIAADYQGWDYETGFNLAQAEAAADAGAIEEIDWEPWNYAKGVDQPAYSDLAIAHGTYDGFLAKWAAGAKAYGKPIFVRFAAEMNGSWDSWAVGVNGNTSADYIAMWRHVYTFVRAQGALNVSWIWSPNVSFPGSTPLPDVYPGNNYVDVVALDGYNWGTAQSGTQWETFDQIFSPDLATLSTLAPSKPVWISEIASAEQGGDKSAWVTNLVDEVLALPQVVGFAWFNFDQPPTDWAVDSSSSSLSAFQSALSGH